MTDLQVNTKLPLRRNVPGTKAKDWCHWPEETLENMDSLYHIQQVRSLFIKFKNLDFVYSIFNNVFDIIHQILILFFKHQINKMKVYGNTNN
jgi:hypothetical protein